MFWESSTQMNSGLCQADQKAQHFFLILRRSPSQDRHSQCSDMTINVHGVATVWKWHFFAPSFVGKEWTLNLLYRSHENPLIKMYVFQSEFTYQVQRRKVTTVSLLTTELQTWTTTLTICIRHVESLQKIYILLFEKVLSGKIKFKIKNKHNRWVSPSQLEQANCRSCC